MLRLFNLLLLLYPQAFRAEFTGEMRFVFVSLIEAGHSPWVEILSLLRGAAYERYRVGAPLAAGLMVAFGSQFLIYRTLLAICLLAAVVTAQPLPKQESATLDEAKAIYTRAFTALRDARSMADMKKLADSLDAPEWTSADRFGRRLLDRASADKELESMLALPPEQRVSTMDIIWAERDGTRMVVVAWMFPREEVRNGHTVRRATLIRDLFDKTPSGWRRILHEKWLPNATIVTIDGKQLSDSNRVTPLK